jgi:hypothetical protein
MKHRTMHSISRCWCERERERERERGEEKGKRDSILSDVCLFIGEGEREFVYRSV